MSLIPIIKTDWNSSDYYSNPEQCLTGEAPKSNFTNTLFKFYDQFPVDGILQKYIKPSDCVLINDHGGNSSTSKCIDNLQRLGIKNITKVNFNDTENPADFIKIPCPLSAEVVSQLETLNMGLSSEDFNVVIDTEMLEAQEVTVKDIFMEIVRVMKFGGRYICFSVAQKSVICKVLDYFLKEGWIVRVHLMENLNSTSETILPFFVFVLTKFKKIPKAMPIIEVDLDGSHKLQRLGDYEEVIQAIVDSQQYAIFRHKINCRATDAESSNTSVCLELHIPGSEFPRYSLNSVDLTKKELNKYAIFIVPQGRETEFLFNSDEGRRQLAESAGFQRLIVARLNRHHHYTDLNDIKSELSSKAIQLAPPDFVRGISIPFLSVGEGIGNRNVVYHGQTDLSGDYVVEDVIGEDGVMFRHLIFLKTSNLVQSEARLMPASRQRNKRRANKAAYVIDHSFLACEHHKALIGCLTMFINLDPGRKLRGLVIGVGGGSLTTFITKHIPVVRIDAVELDPEIIKIAERWFELRRDETNRIHIADGLAFVNDKAALMENCGEYDFIILDVDSKDLSKGLSCPPEAFVEELYLKKLRYLLCNNGIFATTIVSRNKVLRDSVVGKIKMIFDYVFCKDIPGELNEVIYAAVVSDKDDESYKTYYDDIKCGGKKFKNNVAKLDALIQEKSPSTNVDISDLFSEGLNAL